MSNRNEYHFDPDSGGESEFFWVKRRDEADEDKVHWFDTESDAEVCCDSLTALEARCAALEDVIGKVSLGTVQPDGGVFLRIARPDGSHVNVPLIGTAAGAWIEWDAKRAALADNGGHG